MNYEDIQDSSSRTFRGAIVAVLMLGALAGCGGDGGGLTESPNPKFKEQRFPPPPKKKVQPNNNT